MNNQTTNYTNYHVYLIPNIWEGVLGMAMAPVQDGLLREHVKKIKEYYQMDLLVCLLEKEDLEWFGIPNQLEVCDEMGLAAEHFPIEDMSVPQNVPAFKALVKKIVEEYLRKEKKVIIHCFGGNGRTGLLVAACFMYEGYTAEQAIIKTRQVRRYAIETTRQQNFLKKLKFEDQQ